MLFIYSFIIQHGHSSNVSLKAGLHGTIVGPIYRPDGADERPIHGRIMAETPRETAMSIKGYANG